MDGSASGRLMRRNTVKAFPPSMNAASSISFEIAWKDEHIFQMQNGNEKAVYTRINPNRDARRCITSSRM